jgi:serine/threonine protein kinase/TolB-like protein/Flp pilus assembly protein TadD
VEELGQDDRAVLGRDDPGELEHDRDARLSFPEGLDHLGESLDELRCHLPVVSCTSGQSELPVEEVEEAGVADSRAWFMRECSHVIFDARQTHGIAVRGVFALTCSNLARDSRRTSTGACGVHEGLRWAARCQNVKPSKFSQGTFDDRPICPKADLRTFAAPRVTSAACENSESKEHDHVHALGERRPGTALLRCGQGGHPLPRSGSLVPLPVEVRVDAGAGDDSGSPKGLKPGALSALLRELVATPEKPEAEPTPLLPGTIIGRFELARELGRGAFGVVYEARDRELGRLVALKIVRPGREGVDESKIAREAEAVARLSHPNLVTLYDVGHSESGPYLVFELLRGKTLQERIDEGPLPVPAAVHVAVEIARGLAHAHAEGVVHRDLKPSNVFVGSRGQVKILDFGMAHAFGRRRVSGGTPAYMAPEQWADAPEDERTDVFALGVILYRMLSAEYPFPDDGGRWSSGPAEAPRLDVPGAPGLEELVGRMLEKAPTSRPRDGAAVLAALLPIEEAPRTQPASDSLPVRAVRRKAILGGPLAAVSSAADGRSALLEAFARDHAGEGSDSRPAVSQIGEPLGTKPTSSALPVRASRRKASLGDLLAELKRRRVFRAMVGYGIFSFAVLQVSEPVMHGAHLPEWVLTAVLVVLAAGFPVAVILAWLFDLTAGGVRRTPLATGPGALSFSRGGLAALLVGAGLLAALPGVAWYAWKTGGVPRSRSPVPVAPASIAVLPFTDMSPQKDQEYLSDGLAEEILNVLTRVEGLRVVGRTSSFYYKGKNVEPAEIGRRLAVTSLLEGSVRRDGNRIRVSAQLMKAADGIRIWSGSYERDLGATFAIQDDIARQVASALEVVLSRASENALLRPATPSLAAYDLYLKARAALRQPGTPATLDRATALFEQSIAADPKFAQAQAGLCDAWLARYELTRAVESYGRAEEACQAALARGQDTGELHAALGTLHLLAGRLEEAEKDLGRARALHYAPVDVLLGLARLAEAQKRLDVAERTFEEARRLDPGDTRVYRLLGIFLFRQGRHAEAARAFEEEIARTTDNASAYANLGAAHTLAGDFQRAAEAQKTSLRLAPTRAGYSNAGTSLYYLGRFDEAVAMYRRALNQAPDDFQMWGNLGDALSRIPAREGDTAAAYRKAVELAEAELRINPGDADALSGLALYHAALGHAELARKFDAEARGREPGNMHIHYNAAVVRVRLGASEAALAELERAVELGYQRQLLAADAGLEPLRHNPRFAALVAPRQPAAGAALPAGGNK